MNKSTQEELKYLAMFVFDEKTYNEFIKFIEKKAYINAKYIIDQVILDFDKKVSQESLSYPYQENEDRQQNIILATHADRLLDLVLEITTNNGENSKKQKSIRKRIRRRDNNRLKIVIQQNI